jgi:mitofusin
MQRVEGVIDVYFRLGKGIEETKYVLADLKNFNDQQWHVRYPSLVSHDKGEESSREFCE